MSMNHHLVSTSCLFPTHGNPYCCHSLWVRLIVEKRHQCRFFTLEGYSPRRTYRHLKLQRAPVKSDIGNTRHTRVSRLPMPDLTGAPSSASYAERCMRGPSTHRRSTLVRFTTPSLKNHPRVGSCNTWRLEFGPLEGWATSYQFLRKRGRAAQRQPEPAHQEPTLASLLREECAVWRIGPTDWVTKSPSNSFPSYSREERWNKNI